MQYWKVLLVLLIALGVGLVLPQTPKVSNIASIGDFKAAGCSEDSKRECTTPEGYVGFRTCSGGVFSQQCFVANIDECSLDEGDLYKICCRTTSGSSYDCSDKESFRAGEYVIVKINLQKAVQDTGFGLDVYKACGFSKLKDADSVTPGHYQDSTAFSDAASGVGCSPALATAVFHQGSIDGIIPSTLGRTTIAEWRAYPTNIDLSTAEKAQESKSRSAQLLEVEVTVGA